MSSFEAMQLMIAFATLVLLIIAHKDQKSNHLIHFGE
ncbi:putative holin-like toxin [Enterococcus mundtii]|nr:putative holin-like toxin [Enterococcus mundtii]